MFAPTALPLLKLKDSLQPRAAQYCCNNSFYLKLSLALSQDRYRERTPRFLTCISLDSVKKTKQEKTLKSDSKADRPEPTSSLMR